MEHVGVTPVSLTPACHTPSPEPSISTERNGIWGRSWVFLVGSLLCLVLSAAGLALEIGSEGYRHLISGGATSCQSHVPLKGTSRSSWRKVAVLAVEDSYLVWFFIFGL